MPGTPVRNCYSQETPPTTQTVPGTVGLTASTTVAGVPTVPATTAAPAQQSEDEPNIVEGLISQARNNQLYQCFFIQRDSKQIEVYSFSRFFKFFLLFFLSR